MHKLQLQITCITCFNCLLFRDVSRQNDTCKAQRNQNHCNQTHFDTEIQTLRENHFFTGRSSSRIWAKSKVIFLFIVDFSFQNCPAKHQTCFTGFVTAGNSEKEANFNHHLKGQENWTWGRKNSNALNRQVRTWPDNKILSFLDLLVSSALMSSKCFC